MSFMFRDRKETEFDYADSTMFEPKKFVKTSGPLRLFAIDGSVLSEKEVSEWLRFSLDVTHYIKAWYKNGDGYFVKLHDSDVFVKLEWSLL